MLNPTFECKHSSFPESTKAYKDLKVELWWSKIKRNIAEWVTLSFVRKWANMSEASQSTPITENSDKGSPRTQSGCNFLKGGCWSFDRNLSLHSCQYHLVWRPSSRVVYDRGRIWQIWYSSAWVQCQIYRDSQFARHVREVSVRPRIPAYLVLATESIWCLDGHFNSVLCIARTSRQIEKD